MNTAKNAMTITAAEHGRSETFLRLIGRYGAALERLARAYAFEPADREDLVQEIATAIWQAIPAFRGDSSERTWLYRIAHNTAITAVQKLRRRGRAETALVDEPVTSRAAGDLRLIEEQRRQLLLAAVRRLAETDRQIVTLHLEGLSHGEIQDVTGLSEGAIATRLSRIRDRLTRELRGEEGRP